MRSRDPRCREGDDVSFESLQDKTPAEIAKQKAAVEASCKKLSKIAISIL